MAINKVVYGANTLIDLTADTVTADTLKTGFTAHDKSGTAITGTLDLAEGSVYQDEDGCVVLNDDDGSGVSYIPLTVSSNGTYTASSSYCYNPVTVNVDNQYYSIYKSLAFRSTIYSSAPGVSEWVDSLSQIETGQFANQDFYGSFTFNNVKRIKTYGFGFARGTTINPQSSFTLNFPSTSQIAHAAFIHNVGITSVNAATCSAIHDSAFYTCTKLVSAIFPAVVSISACAFEFCYSLTTISFPACSYIAYSAFTACSELSLASFPAVSYIADWAFLRCSKLSLLSFPSVTTLSRGAFASCISLSSASFPSCITIGSSCFSACGGLTAVSFPNCERIEYGGFSTCYKLESAYFPNCTTLANFAFYNCSSLVSVNFPVCTSIGQSVFCSCFSLQYASFPAVVSIATCAFKQCSELSVFSIASTCGYIGGSAFAECTKLESVYVHCSLTTLPTLGNTNAFSSTPLRDSSYLGYFGSIYVKSSLLESFKTATNWSYYSARMVGF